jgi:hypothetical protein
MSELRLWRELWPVLSPGEIVLGDRFYCTEFGGRNTDFGLTVAPVATWPQQCSSQIIFGLIPGPSATILHVTRKYTQRLRPRPIHSGGRRRRGSDRGLGLPLKGAHSARPPAIASAMTQ